MGIARCSVNLDIDDGMATAFNTLSIDFVLHSCKSIKGTRDQTNFSSRKFAFASTAHKQIAIFGYINYLISKKKKKHSRFN